jgi:circadian clock protein KaiB
MHAGWRQRLARENGMARFELRLYITGRTVHSDSAITNLRRICEQDLGAEYELEVIDVLERPQLAEVENILATPTLLRVMPLPPQRMVGDLSDRERVLQVLGVHVNSCAHAPGSDLDGKPGRSG